MPTRHHTAPSLPTKAQDEKPTAMRLSALPPDRATMASLTATSSAASEAPTL